jgi:hypothetical protein
MLESTRADRCSEHLSPVDLLGKARLFVQDDFTLFRVPQVDPATALARLFIKDKPVWRVLFCAASRHLSEAASTYVTLSSCTQNYL